MNQLAIVQEQTPPPAEESIARIRAMLTGTVTRNQIADNFSRLDTKQRGVLLIASGLKPEEHLDRSFDEFDHLEKQRIREGMCFLKSLQLSLEHKVGDPRQLKYRHFQQPV
ncbi:hypothetical protein [Vibrio quintilis]|uniref:Uncharacterized protein n=1 Tax=Vibrio quintilis TaxID=1117707 RepID=A0A1M7YZ09_9VIBR|nr:hypothetical protein [Vibrio quintilis]SHO57860.1 hypothetical protein VQ7734_03630 [Vibrio quintilis]